MQEVIEPSSLDDDMMDGDLGDGIGVLGDEMGILGDRMRVLGNGMRVRAAERSEGVLLRSSWRQTHLDCLADLTREELKEKLQEAAEVIDALCCELDVTHQYLKGKYEALKILQGKAILQKATSHTNSLLQKSEETARALEKEVNSLQWDLSFLQVQMKKSDQSWEQKYNRVLRENQTLTEHLEEMEAEIQQLRGEHFALTQHHSELLSLLSLKEQRVFQTSRPQLSPERDCSVLELAVLGACCCPGGPEACPCSRIAAASRKQLVQLQQELEAQRSRRDEAVMVGDAFRIAFEQQLKKRSEHFLLLAETSILKSHTWKAEGCSRSPFTSVNQKLRSLLPSSLEVKMSEDLSETLYRLLDLLNDKDEALAHQRKVSLMLAHSAEELQKQLHLDSGHRIQPGSSETMIQSKNPPETRIHLKDPAETMIQSKNPPETKIHLKDPPETMIQSKDPTETRIKSKDPTETRIKSNDLSETRIQPKDPPETRIKSKDLPETRIQPKDPPETRIKSKDPPEIRIQPKDSPEIRIQPKDSPETRIQPKDSPKTRIQSQDPQETRIQSKDPQETRIQSKDPQETRIQSQTSSTSDSS
ncbi:coiled-coil domain-containing protein 125 isoform X2 [Embiotoca jacksoni]